MVLKFLKRSRAHGALDKPTPTAKPAKASLKAPLLSRLSKHRRPAKIDQAAPTIMLLSSASGLRVLALGLRWRAVVTHSKHRELMTQALSDRATHCVSAPTLLGIGALPKAAALEAESAFAAAMLAAHHAQQQDAVFALALPDDRIWLCQISAGRPSGPEEILESDIQASHRIDQLRQANDQLEVWSSIDDIADRKHYSFEDLMLLPPPAQAKLRVVKSENIWRRMPVAARVATGLAMTAVVAMQGWNYWKDSLRVERQRQNAAAQAAKLDQARLAWSSQIMSALATKSAQVDLTKLRASLNRLPVIWQGWRLDTAKCQSDQTDRQGNDSVKNWRCLASYSAPDVKQGVQFSPNKSLIAPAGFETKYLPTKAVQLAWTVQTPSTPLNNQQLPARSEHLVGAASLLQMNLQDLASAPEIKFAPLSIAAPKMDDGLPAPMPSDLTVPLRAELTFKSSISVADALVERIHADWSSMTLTLTMSDDKNKSGLDIEWTGALYAKP